MYGDTEVMRRRVGQLREQAADIRASADRLVAGTEALGWHGRAAESMRQRITERASHLREAAAAHDTAADSLDRHLREVDHAQESIAAIERRATALVAGARERVEAVEREREQATDPGSSGVITAARDLEVDPDDVTLVGFDPPPQGHRDWLAVELPGL